MSGEMMRAAVLKGPSDLMIYQVLRPTTPPGGLLIEVKACAICATDIKMTLRGQRDLVYPRILGHEVAGVIVCSDAPGLQTGLRVQIAPGLPCGTCTACRKGASNLCPQIGILGFTHDGGFARYLAVPKESVACGGVNLIPEGLDFELACLAEPLACCINGQERAGVGEGDTVLVWGAGPIGLLHTMLAKARGASKVLLAEKSSVRLEAASSINPDRLIDSASEDISRTVMEETDGVGVDVVMIACPETPVAATLAGLLAPRGRICFFSGLRHNPVPVDLNAIHYRELCYAGAYGCTAGQNRVALDLISSGEIAVDRLISERISLEEIHRAFDDIVAHRALKIIVTEF